MRWTEVVAQSDDRVLCDTGPEGGFPEWVVGMPTSSHFAKAMQQAGTCRVP